MRLNLSLLFLIAIISSCTATSTDSLQNSGNMQANTGTTVSTIDVKDKTAYPPLLTAVPDEFNKGGWLITKNTQPVVIPNGIPTTNIVYHSAEKEIGVKKRSISVVEGNLLKETGAIVNAANGGLTGGGGIDGAIHKAALVNGNDLMKEEAIAYKKLHKIGSFPNGSAMVTHPYALAPSITMVVFTVGPQGASTPQKDLELYSATYNSLLKASEYGATSVSLPAISTGIFGFPIDVAAKLFFKAALEFFHNNSTTSIEAIRLTNLDFGNAPAVQKTTQAMADGFLAAFKA